MTPSVMIGILRMKVINISFLSCTCIASEKSVSIYLVFIKFLLHSQPCMQQVLIIESWEEEDIKEIKKIIILVPGSSKFSRQGLFSFSFFPHDNKKMNVTRTYNFKISYWRRVTNTWTKFCYFTALCGRHQNLIIEHSY